MTIVFLVKPEEKPTVDLHTLVILIYFIIYKPSK